MHLFQAAKARTAIWDPVHLVESREIKPVRFHIGFQNCLLSRYIIRYLRLEELHISKAMNETGNTCCDI